MKGNRPVALIVRLKVSDRGDEKPPTSYLIVSKISGMDACVTDIVKPVKGKTRRLRVWLIRRQPNHVKKQITTNLD